MSFGRDALIIAWVLGAAYVFAPPKPHQPEGLKPETQNHAGHAPRPTKGKPRAQRPPEHQ